MRRWRRKFGRGFGRGLVVCAVSGALLAPPASAATQDFFEDGIPGAMGNLVVGARGDQTFDPVAAWISPTGALQRFPTYAATGSLIEVEPLPDGDYIALLEGQNQFRLVRFNADLTPDEACGPNGVGPATTAARHPRGQPPRRRNAQ